MAYAIRTLTGMPAALADALARVGVSDTEALLAVARFPSKRDALASELGIDAGELDTWASVSDLLRVTVFTPPVAELVVRSGVARNVQEVAQALGAAQGAEATDPPTADDAATNRRQQALTGLESFARERGWRARVPWPADLAMAAEEASNLTPRLVLRERALEDDEWARLRSLERKVDRHNVRTLIGSLAIVVALAAVMGLGLSAAYRGSLSRSLEALRRELTIADANRIVDTLGAWGWEIASANLFGLAVVVGIVIGLLAAGIVATDVSDRLWTRFGLRFVLRSADARRAYLRIVEDEVQGAAHLARAFYGVVMVAIAVAAAVLWATDMGTRGDRPLGETLAGTVALILPPFIVILVWPSVGRLVRRYHRADPARASVIRGIIVYRTGDVVRGIAVIVVFLLVLAPVLNIATGVGEGVVRVRVERSTEAVEREFDALAVEGVIDPTQREGFREFASEFGQRHGSIATMMTETIEEITRDVLPTFVRALVPSLLLVLLLFIVVPFLVLGGWLRGAFFLVLLIAITFTETSAQRVVTEQLTQVFALPGDSPLALLLVGFAVFGNAILFEWVFEFTVDRKPPCAGCRAPVERGARFCSHCGMAHR